MHLTVIEKCRQRLQPGESGFRTNEPSSTKVIPWMHVSLASCHRHVMIVFHLNVPRQSPRANRFLLFVMHDVAWPKANALHGGEVFFAREFYEFV